MTVVVATNCQRAYAANGQSLAVDFASHVIDFADMPMGVVHFLWTGALAPLAGVFKIYGSALPDLGSFDPDGTLIDGAEVPLHVATGSRLWIRDRLSFRYGLVRYVAGGTLGGTCQIIAMGKKS